MSGRVFATLGLVVMLLGTQGCGTFNAIFLELLKAAGRVTPPGPIPCGEQSVLVLPGSCTPISNVCREDRGFVTGDSFAFDDPPEWLSARRSNNSVDVCAASNAPPLVDTPFPYTYADRRPSAGELRLSTVGTSVSATASATPGQVTIGESTQLNVVPQGGQGPYTFAWRQLTPAAPVSVLSNAMLQNPVASIVGPPDQGFITFEVTVTDAAGQTATAHAGLGVTGFLLSVTVTATPSAITRGESSQLHATVQGGIPPFMYHWSPGLDLTPFPFFEADEVATPRDTTLFELRVTDFTGAEATANVMVTVLPPPATDQVDLVVTVVDTPDPVVTNRLLTYTTTVTNNGPATATNVQLTLLPPSNIESNSAMPSQGTCMRTSLARIDCAIGTLIAGATATVTLEGFPFQPGTLSFRSFASPDRLLVDSNPANNDVTQTTTVIANPPPN